MSDRPRTHYPLDGNGEPDTGRPVELYQHRPDTTDELAAWCGGTVVVINGGPAVVLPGRDVVGLGDYAAHDGDRYRVERAAGLSQRYRAADADTNPPVD